MTADRELSEYRILCTTFGNLYEKFQKRKLEIRELLRETSARRREAFLILAKANRFTRHLTGNQRQKAGITYHLAEIERRVNQAGVLAHHGNLDGAESLKDIPVGIHDANFVAGNPAGYRNAGELRRMGLAVIRMIDNIKKYLLQFDLLEKRCRELILSIKKALQAFRHEFKVIYRKIHPFGVFSFLRRFFRKLFGSTYFTSRDMSDVGALGNITALVLKIADTPLM